MTDKTMEADGDAKDGEGEAKPKGKGKLLIIAAAGGLVLLLAGGGAAAYFMGMFGGKAAHKEAEKPAAPVVATYVQLPDLLVNLSSTGRRNNFIKLKITLELEKPTDQDRVKTMQPRIIDNFQTYLRNLRLEDLQGAQGLFRLREELLVRINAAVAPAKVTDILFQEMLVQ
ncbi:MAG: flagellar basal body-associated FliL family protein [Alphaproteobacteria bacterium]|nr:flagellar basal body-associated FliL family protein [Alphaproteobacteria bacterium]